jgi:hypothetical protein
MAVATGPIVQATLQMLLDGQTVENVLHFRARTDATTTGDMDLELRAFWDIYKAGISTDVTLIQIVRKIMTPAALDAEFVVPADGHQIGGRSSTPIANSLAVVITLRTGTAGKRHRGRIYYPGLGNNLAEDNTNKVSGSGITLLNDMCSDVLALFDDEDGTSSALALGMYSRVIGGTNPFTVAGWQSLTQMIPRKILGNQRRRRIGIGI